MNTHPIEELPAYLNQTLDAVSREQVQAHVADCQRCQQELAFLEAVRDGLQQPLPATNDVALARLMRDIRAEKKQAAPTSGWKRAFIAAAALVLVQSLLLTQLWRSEDALYQPLSGVTEQGIIIVRFQPDAREADIRALLRALDVQLVEGPAASGLYRLHSYREDLEPVVRQLRNQPHIVAEALVENGES